LDALATPTAAPPVMFGAPAPPGELLPWSWAQQRLETARTYWIATTRPDSRPHCRPVWGVWLPDGFWFSTGSLARHNLALSFAGGVEWSRYGQRGWVGSTWRSSRSWV
jgi:hypothetical protein